MAISFAGLATEELAISSAGLATEELAIEAALSLAVKQRSVEELNAVLARAARERFAGDAVTAASKLRRVLVTLLITELPVLFLFLFLF